MKSMFSGWVKRAIALSFGLLAAFSVMISPAALADEISHSAEAVIMGTTDESASLVGDVRFYETAAGLKIEAGVAGAPPGKHGFHIHENGSCDEGGSAAGGHFNPDNVQHGLLVRDGFENAHAGDLGNIEIADSGEGMLEQTIPGLALNEGKYAIADRAVIVHAQPDDFGQPTGNAGGRIGCGIIHTVN